MEGISLINPFSNEYNALEEFKKLTVIEQVATVAVTIIAALASVLVGTTAIFRLMVNHFKVMHPNPNRNQQPPNVRPTPEGNSSQVDTQSDPSQALGLSNFQQVTAFPVILTDLSNLLAASITDAKLPLTNPTPLTNATPLTKATPLTDEPLDPFSFISTLFSLPEELPSTTTKKVGIPEVVQSTSVPLTDKFPSSEVTTTVETPKTEDNTLSSQLPSSEVTTETVEAPKVEEKTPLQVPSSDSTTTVILSDAEEDKVPFVVEDHKSLAALEVEKLDLNSLATAGETYELLVAPAVPFINSSTDTINPQALDELYAALLKLNLKQLLPAEIAAKKSHEVALVKIDKTDEVLDVLGSGNAAKSIKSVTHFEINQDFKVKSPIGNVSVQVAGEAYKAEIAGVNGNFAYMIKALVQQGANSFPVELAFLTKKDADDVVALGNLVLEHLEQQPTLSLAHKEDGMLTLPFNPQETSTPVFKGTVDLPSPLVEEILSPAAPSKGALSQVFFGPVGLPTLAAEAKSPPSPSLSKLTIPPQIDYKGPIKEKATEADLQKILDEVNESTESVQKMQDALNKGVIEENAAIKEAEDEEKQVNLDLFASLAGKETERKTLGLTEEQCNLVPYVEKYIKDFMSTETNPTHEIKDTDKIAFTKDLTIVKAGDEAEAKHSYRVFHCILKETFGSILAGRIFGRYRLTKKDTITLRDLKKAMVGVAQNVLVEDLKRLFMHIKVDDRGELTSYKAGNLLFDRNSILYSQIKNKGKKGVTFEELTSEEINFLHSAFRVLPLEKTGVSVLKVLEDFQKNSEGEDYLYVHDLDALKLVESWNQLEEQYPRWALGEFTGKSLAYLELKKGQILPLPQVQNDKLRTDTPYLYKVESSLQEKNDGVIANLLTPVHKGLSLYSGPEQKNEHAFLVFRGTLATKHAKSGGKSVERDLNHKGIGRKSYELREEEIQQMVENYLANSQSESVSIHISGHSLGGCDSQRALVSLLEKVSEAKEGSPWKKLKKLEVTTFNAPKVNPTTNLRLKVAVRTIIKNNIEINVDLDHLRFFDKSYEDTVQGFGDILLGADLQGDTGDKVFDKCSWFKRRIVNITMDDDKGWIKGALDRHGYRPFNKSLNNLKYDIKILSADSDNEDERKAVENLMAGNFKWDASEMGKASQIIHSFIWYTSTLLFRHPKKAIQAVVNVIHSSAIGIDHMIHGAEYADLDDGRTH